MSDPRQERGELAGALRFAASEASRNLQDAPELARRCRVFAGTTTYAGKVALRPAIVNWRTEQADVDLIVDVVRELIARFRQPPARAAGPTRCSP